MERRAPVMVSLGVTVQRGTTAALHGFGNGTGLASDPFVYQVSQWTKTV